MLVREYIHIFMEMSLEGNMIVIKLFVALFLIAAMGLVWAGLVELVAYLYKLITKNGD